MPQKSAQRPHLAPMAEFAELGPPCEFKHPRCPHTASWAVTDPKKGTDRFLCERHVGLFSTGPDAWPATKIECVDMAVIDTEDDGTRVVRVYVRWGDELRSSDVRFDRETWEAAGGI
jgi:hypothetical protein